MSYVEDFRQNIIDSGYVLDAEGTHHEFVSGMHGQKLDFDKIEDDSALYRQWLEVGAEYIREEFPKLPEVILGVANGTNRVAEDMVELEFESEVHGLVSAKDPENSKRLYLPEKTLDIFSWVMPQFVVVFEDVGTTGSNSVQVAQAALEAGADRVEVISTWKRRPVLEKLEEAGIPNRAIIDEPLTTFSPEDCLDHGFCAQGWEFIPRK